MKKEMILLTAALLSCHIVFSQASWSSWQTIYSNGTNRVQISFKLADCGNVAGTYTLKGYSYYRINNETLCDKCHLTFKFQYEDCDGQLKNNLVNFSMDKVGIEDDMGQWFLGPKVIRSFYEVEFKNYSNKPSEKKSTTDTYSLEAQQAEANRKALEQQQKRNQQLINQVNAIKSQQQQQSQQIWNVHSSVTGLLGQMQQKNIRKYTQEMVDSRDRAFQQVQQELKNNGGTGLRACYSCNGNGIQQCVVCDGDPFSSCNYCRGSGKVQSFGSTIACSLCYGQGQKACNSCFGVGSKLCNECYGSSYEVTYTKELTDNYNYTTTPPTPPEISTGVSGAIQKIWVEYNSVHNQAQGMMIHIKFQVNNMKSLTGSANAYFYFENGTPLKDFNGLYRTVDNSVSTFAKFTPAYESTVFNDFAIFIPNNELHITEKGKFNLKFNVELFYQETESSYKSLFRSDWQYFSLQNN